MQVIKYNLHSFKIVQSETLSLRFGGLSSLHLKIFTLNSVLDLVSGQMGDPRSHGVNPVRGIHLFDQNPTIVCKLYGHFLAENRFQLYLAA